MLSTVYIDDHLHAFCFSQDGSVLITGGKRGLVVLRWAKNLELASSGCRERLNSIVDGRKCPENNSAAAGGNDRAGKGERTDQSSYINNNNSGSNIVTDDENSGAFNCAIRSICFSKDEQHLLVGLESGQLRILSQDPSYLRPKLRDALKGLGF